eukprot:scaffold161114_cov18-Tisochrysis_lutea.AAC.1
MTTLPGPPSKLQGNALQCHIGIRTMKCDCVFCCCCGPTRTVSSYETLVPCSITCEMCSLKGQLSQAKRGGLRNTDATDLMATVFKAVLDKTSVDPKV